MDGNATYTHTTDEESRVREKTVTLVRRKLVDIKVVSTMREARTKMEKFPSLRGITKRHILENTRTH